jgi:hypothetical protein
MCEVIQILIKIQKLSIIFIIIQWFALNKNNIYSLNLLVFKQELYKMIYHIKLLNETRVVNRHFLIDHSIKP